MMAPFYSIHPHPESQSSGSRGVSRVVQCTYRVDDSLETLWIVFARRPPGPARWLSVAGRGRGQSTSPDCREREWRRHGGDGGRGGNTRCQRANSVGRRVDLTGWEMGAGGGRGFRL